MVFGQLQTIDTLTILPTYKCTAACQDCCFGSNPSLEGRIPQDSILHYIEDAAALGIKTLVFSGGEAFILGTDLDKAIEHATQHGIATRIVTNGYWAIDEYTAEERLKKLRLAGLDEINFSTGDFHQKFVPIDRVVNGTLAAVSLEMRCGIMIEIRKERLFSKQELMSNPRLSALLENKKYANLIHIVESPWIPNFDSEIIPQEKEILANSSNIHARKGCNSILSTFVVDPSERLGACCGLTRDQIPELNIGSLKEKSMAEMVREAFDDFLKVWIYVDGPEKILAWAATKDSSIEWENKYAHMCHACRELYHNHRVRKVIVKYHEEKLLDVYFRYWLLTSYGPKLSQESIESKKSSVNHKIEFIFG